MSFELESADAAPGATGGHQRRKAERPQELLQAALDLFVEHGFAATRIDDVAQRAGVSKGTLYLYYASKVELLKAVIRHYVAGAIANGAEQAQQYEGSTADLMRDVLGNWWVQLLDSPASGVFKLVITEVRNFPELAEFYGREVVEPGHRTIGMMVQRGIDRGEFRSVDVDAAVHSILFPMVMLCLHKHSIGACGPLERQVDAVHFIRAHIDLLVNGLKSGAASGGASA